MAKAITPAGNSMSTVPIAKSQISRFVSIRPLQASFRSKCIERWALRDPVIKLTVGILFRYKILNDPSPPPLDEPWK
jgi:hypothetical protein